MSAPLLVYLLHFSMPDGGSRHYVGITRAGRLPARMREHAAGIGSRFTRAMLATGATFVVARTWAVFDPLRERAIKRSGHFKEKCPVCTDGLRGVTGFDAAPRRATFPLRPVPSNPSLNW